MDRLERVILVLRSRIVSVTPNGADEIGYTSANDIVYIPSYETQVERVPFGTQLGDNFNQFIGLSLNVPVFNRGSVSNSVKQAKINRSLAELQLEQEKNWSASKNRKRSG